MHAWMGGVERGWMCDHLTELSRSLAAFATMLMLGGGVKGGQVRGRWPGLAPLYLVDGDLSRTSDYRLFLAEVLERRCRVGSGGSVFPGVGSARPDVVHQRA